MNTAIEFELIGAFRGYTFHYVDPSSDNLRKVNFNANNVGKILVDDKIKRHRFFVRVMGSNGSEFTIKFSDNVKTPSKAVRRKIKMNQLYTSVQSVYL